MTDGEIKFDYLCAAGNAPGAQDEHQDVASTTDEKEMGGRSPSSAFTNTVNAVAVYGAIVASTAGILSY